MAGSCTSIRMRVGGKYDTGEAARPWLLLALLSHYRRDSILENCEVVFYLSNAILTTSKRSRRK